MSIARSNDMIVSQKSTQRPRGGAEFEAVSYNGDK
jgi:hypothetical protein